MKKSNTLIPLIIKGMWFFYIIIYKIFGNKNKPAINFDYKEIVEFNLNAYQRILFLHDNHLGSDTSNPWQIIWTINKFRPDVIVYIGDLFDKPDYKLRPDEQEALDKLIAFGNVFGQKLIVLHGDHDKFLYEQATFHFPVYQKIIITFGRRRFLITHGDEYQYSQHTNGFITDNIIVPAYEGLRKLGLVYKINFIKNLLEAIKETKPVIEELKHIGNNAIQDARNNHCEAVIIGHSHKSFLIKKYIRKTKRYLKCYILGSSPDNPHKYAALTKKTGLRRKRIPKKYIKKD